MRKKVRESERAKARDKTTHENRGRNARSAWQQASRNEKKITTGCRQMLERDEERQEKKSKRKLHTGHI